MGWGRKRCVGGNCLDPAMSRTKFYSINSSQILRITYSANCSYSHFLRITLSPVCQDICASVPPAFPGIAKFSLTAGGGENRLLAVHKGISIRRSHETLAQAMGRVLAGGTGIGCPHGCGGCAARVYGLVRHLVVRHGYTELAAWRKWERMTREGKGTEKKRAPRRAVPRRDAKRGDAR